VVQSAGRLLDLDKDRFIHFIGIGGTGMSGVAGSMAALGYCISGSDMASDDIISVLKNEGVRVFHGHNSANIFSGTQLVVRSAAIKEDNPEMFAAKLRNIPVIKYAEMLGMLMKEKRGIAISGTHGKTTITALVSFVLTRAGLDPGFVVGGNVPQLGGGSQVGHGRFFVAEACEYGRSFLALFPWLAVVNNIEEDHLDCYSGIDEIRATFKQFIRKIPPDGVLLMNDCITGRDEMVEGAGCSIKWFGVSDECDYRLEDIVIKSGITSAKAVLPGKRSVDLELKLIGEHNLMNTLCALAVSTEVGIEPRQASEILGEFRGVSRRMELLLRDQDQIVMDDYAHHPTEIRTVLSSLRRYFPEYRSVVVFQPHQHSRTRFLLKDFARSFSDADLVVVPDIYFVRDSEAEKKNIHSRDLVNEIIHNGGNAVYIPSFGEIEQFLINNLLPSQLTITMGAGDVWMVARQLSQRLTAAGTAEK